MATPVLDQQRAGAVARGRTGAGKSGKPPGSAEPARTDRRAQGDRSTRAKAALVLSQDRIRPPGSAAAQGRDHGGRRATRPNSRSIATRPSSPRRERQIEAALLPSRTQEIAAAEAAIPQAQAQLQQIDVRIAPPERPCARGGDHPGRYFWPGEIVAAGQPVLALLPPENRKIRFYVPETQLARFSLGAKVAVSCDNCPPASKPA